MRQVSRRTLLTWAAAAGPAVWLAACSNDDATNPATTQPGAAPTGTLNLLNFAGWAGPTTYEDFAAAYPGAAVNEIAWASNDDTITKARNRAGDLDVALVDGTTFPRLAALGVLAPLGNVPNMVHVGQAYRGNTWDAADEFFAPTDHGRTGIVYRRDLVATPPTSWADFVAMAPEYSGRVAMLDYQRSVMGNLMVMLGHPNSSAESGHLAEVQAQLLKLKPHLLAVTGEVGKAVATGDAVMAMCDAYDAQLALSSNPDVVFVDPSEGQVGYLEGFVILDGPRNELARAFIDFFLEPANYASFINTVASPYVQPDNAGIDADLRQSPVINPPASVIERLSYHEFLGEAQGAWDAVWDAFGAA
jgi:spermidine/putrescine transport system substrate-binding protein